jgi:hypothetical protein
MVTWDETLHKFLHVTDKLGKEIDTGILDTVVVLNMVGATTTASCEGHLDWGLPFPWVIFEHDKALLYRINQHLSAFYKTRPLNFDTLLHLDGCRLCSLEARFSNFFTPEEREEKLQSYRAEMMAFTDFLKAMV